MKNVLITGGTGLIGKQLVDKLLQQDVHVYILSRKDHQSDHGRKTFINWSKEGFEHEVPDIDIVINLAGASLFQYWTPKARQSIMMSRLKSTQRLYELFKDRNYKPEVLFNASAIGYYPPDAYETYTESFKTLPFDFLSDVVYQWERTAQKFTNLNTRVVMGRFGIVLSQKGGALGLMALPYRLFLGGQLGSGKQWYSWVHIDDLTDAIMHLIFKSNGHGPYNLTAPMPERQDLFCYGIGQTLHRPHYTYVPAPLIRLAIGKLSTIIIDTQKVLPNRLSAEGFKFKYPNIKIAFNDLFNKK
ncbi:TIGR01777 family oxidoreductase [Staphylococcus massiliensis]|uniref:TIGR01777 family oxidoreductase n=1 Tax=Staphylococcus massiliensis TaxID=555791 RepID=UPI001EDE0A19|nr:TIGR01777 family oxidoreductase [Staphylococcus massiliensis]MCG3400386.1 TIGR01777 family oxidoreductase [Staphylococcus massiliensis]